MRAPSRNAARTVATIAVVSWLLLAGATGTAAAAARTAGVRSALRTAAPAASKGAVWAEPIGTRPDDIFPFVPRERYTLGNVEHFQQLMYRPLYWFAGTTAPTLTTALSLASPPVYAHGDTQVTVTLKPWRWSDGTAVTPEDVMFWLNMLHAEKANWAAYQPSGDDLPDNLAAAAVTGRSQVTFTLTAPVDPAWFTDNQLSQITPMPLAWDRTTATGAPGSGGCAIGLYGTVDNQCAQVYGFLLAQAGYNPTPSEPPDLHVIAQYATNALWHVVDGPWRLARFSTTGDATFSPNPRYSGPLAPTLASFTERAFNSDDAEVAALRAGQLSVGYLPLGPATPTTDHPREAGPNAGGLGAYGLVPVYTAAIDDTAVDFGSSGDGGVAGAILAQLPVRAAMEDLIDQPALVASVDRGYGLVDTGPLPPVAAGGAGRARGTPGQPDPYPYDPTRAVSELRAHGWAVVAGGTTTCAHPGTGSGECGAGIPAGARLALTLRYPKGATQIAALLGAESRSWATAGIHVTLVPEPPADVEGAGPPCTAGCAWELATFGGGWLFSPDHYPSGEYLFVTAASANAGGYSDQTTDADVAATIAGTGSLDTYARRVATQLPVLFQPVPVASLTEVHTGLVAARLPRAGAGAGAAPPQVAENVVGGITPEAWRWQG